MRENALYNVIFALLTLVAPAKPAGKRNLSLEGLEELGASEVSKTDAREFALLAAFQYPERVAELMREEGFGALS